jgi:HPt (histidine-containing phosphotransfer) domain-containing protein
MPVKETALSSAIFDQLRLAMAADPVGFANLYRDYLADAWQTLQNLQANVEEGEFSTVQPRAHSLKGSSLLFGAHVLARQAARFEDAVIATSFGDASTVLEDMLEALRDVQLELVDRLGPGVLPSGKTAS